MPSNVIKAFCENCQKEFEHDLSRTRYIPKFCKSCQKKSEGSRGRKSLDLTNRKFGKLTVLSKTAERRHGNVVWECRCDCGNTFKAESSNLIRLRTKSCGCLQHLPRGKAEGGEKRGRKIIDITNQKFAKLTVIRLLEERRNNQPMWLCKCECGNTNVVRRGDLANGKVKSCGCLRKERKTVDLVRLKFDKLTVICQTDQRKHGQVLWLCECECGSSILLTNFELTKKTSFEKSCGCRRLPKKIRRIAKRKNIHIERIPEVVKVGVVGDETGKIEERPMKRRSRFFGFNWFGRKRGWK